MSVTKAKRSRFSPATKFAMGGAFIASIAMWGAIYYFLPPISGMESIDARLVFTLKCLCFAVLFCFLSGIEAISHERLQTDAFDPLAGHETRCLKVNLRYLQNTLEQLILFVPGLLGLSIYCADGSSMRAVVAATALWIVSRFVFWIGYHRGSLYRVFGLVGMPQSMILLLFVCSRFGNEIGGLVGAFVPILLFIVIEVFLVIKTRPAKA